MARKLKERAKGNAEKSVGKLASKAKSRSNLEAKTQEEIEREGQMPAAPGMAESMPFNSAPPLPPALAYIRKFASIPSLRKEGQGG